MDNRDLEWMFALLILVVLLCGIFISAQAYDHLEDPCASGGLEVCDMEPLVKPDLWRYQCHGLALPEVWYCTGRRARRWMG